MGPRGEGLAKAKARRVWSMTHVPHCVVQRTISAPGARGGQHGQCGVTSRSVVGSGAFLKATADEMKTNGSSKSLIPLEMTLYTLSQTLHHVTHHYRQLNTFKTLFDMFSYPALFGKFQYLSTQNEPCSQKTLAT